MAYNKDKEIVIVDTSSWEVKKKLSDENVGSVEFYAFSFELLLTVGYFV